VIRQHEAMRLALFQVKRRASKQHDHANGNTEIRRTVDNEVRQTVPTAIRNAAVAGIQRTVRPLL
jgi:hypothetical protein